jgi:HSP20 family protein
MLTRYEKFHSPTLDLLDSFGFFGELSSAKPRADTIDNEGIKIEMPGVNSADLEVLVEGRLLKVSGKSRHGKEFSYTYTLRGAVDETLIKAHLQDGLLEISLPKKADSKARKIPIT